MFIWWWKCIDIYIVSSTILGVAWGKNNPCFQSIHNQFLASLLILLNIANAPQFVFQGHNLEKRMENRLKEITDLQFRNVELVFFFSHFVFCSNYFFFVSLFLLFMHNFFLVSSCFLTILFNFSRKLSSLMLLSSKKWKMMYVWDNDCSQTWSLEIGVPNSYLF